MTVIDSSEQQRHWDKKHTQAQGHGEAQPDADLVKHIDHVPQTGVALDLACGRGRNSLFLAQYGLDVICLDISIRALEKLRQQTSNDAIAKKLFPVQADLTRITLAYGSFDLVGVMRYLDRMAFPGYLQILKTGGLLFIKTLNRNHLMRYPEFNPDYLLTPGELKHRFCGSQILHSNDDTQMKDFESFILLRK